MNKIRKVFILLFGVMACLQVTAQDKIVNPDISYAGNPRNLVIGGINVSGVEGYEDYVLTGISGLSVGDRIDVPGDDVTNAVKRYWKHGLFSKVAIAADSIVGEKLYLHIYLAVRPRISNINYIGLKKSEREDMEQKLGMVKGTQVTPNMLDRAKILAKKYFDDKGFKNADIQINQRDDVANKGQVILDVIVDKKEKIKVHQITIDGNEKLSDRKIKGGLFSKGAFAKTHEAGKFATFFKSKKFTPERWKEDKAKLIDKYYEYGYRDAQILEDSVSNYDEKHVNVYVKVDEGKQYFIRNITWVGNTVYNTDRLNALLTMKKGDVYNQKLLHKRLNEDDDAVGNLYYNNGYVFSNINPAEINIDGDSIDLEMRVTEGPQAYLSHVRINGNTRLYENVVRRELRTKPGDLFSKDAVSTLLMRSSPYTRISRSGRRLASRYQRCRESFRQSGSSSVVTAAWRLKLRWVMSTRLLSRMASMKVVRNLSPDGTSSKSILPRKLRLSCSSELMEKLLSSHERKPSCAISSALTMR